MPTTTTWDVAQLTAELVSVDSVNPGLVPGAAGEAPIVDLLAAIPSVIYGLWGIQWLQPVIHPLFEWLSVNLGWIPLFSEYQAPARNIMTVEHLLTHKSGLIQAIFSPNTALGRMRYALVNLRRMLGETARQVTVQADNDA